MKTCRFLSPFRFLSLLFLTGLTACSTDMDDEESLYGNWVEEVPVPGRSALYFHPGNRLTQVENGEITDQFSFTIKGDSISLWIYGEDEESGTYKLFLKQEDQNSLRVQNFFPAIPEMEPTVMVFRRN